MSERFYLDSPSLVYRAFFSWPTTITDPAGRPVNAVRGFMEMVTRMVVDHHPDDIVAVFDAEWRPAFRVEAYAGYKAERPDDPPELPAQFDVLAVVLDAAGICCIEAPELEADDAIATLIEGKEAAEMATVVTGDRDLLPLVRDPDVRLLFPLRGVRDVIVFDETAVEAKYGVPPRLYADFATLRGDPSDGLPGVPGIGPVRAAKLLSEFGSVAGIIANLEELPPTQKATFEEALDYLLAARGVVELVRDARLSATEPHPPELDRLEFLGAEHNLGSSAVRLAQALAGER